MKNTVKCLFYLTLIAIFLPSCGESNKPVEEPKETIVEVDTTSTEHNPPKDSAPIPTSSSPIIQQTPTKKPETMRLIQKLEETGKKINITAKELSQALEDKQQDKSYLDNIRAQLEILQEERNSIFEELTSQKNINAELKKTIEMLKEEIAQKDLHIKDLIDLLTFFNMYYQLNNEYNNLWQKVKTAGKKVECSQLKSFYNKSLEILNYARKNEEMVKKLKNVTMEMLQKEHDKILVYAFDKLKNKKYKECFGE